MSRALLTLCASTCLAFPATSAAHEGWGIVRDAQGHIYVADIPGSTIWRIARDGGATAVARDVHSHAVVLGPDGAVYWTHVAFADAARGVWRLDATGRVSAVIPPTRGFPLDLQAFLLGADGSIYSASLHEAALAPEARRLFLLRRRSDGSVDTLAGGVRGAADGHGRRARFLAIDGMAWLSDSSMVLVDGARLRRVTRDGAVQTLTRELTDRRWDEDLLGVSAGPAGVMYVADFAGRRVLRVEHDSARAIATTGRYWSPTGVLATADGIYTLEHPRAPLGILGDLAIGPYLRVRLLSPDGSSQLIAQRWGSNTAIAALLLAAVVVLPFMARNWRRTRRQQRVAA